MGRCFAVGLAVVFLFSGGAAAATLMGDTVIGHIFKGAGDALPATPFTVDAGAEYWDSYGGVCSGVVFCATTGFDVSSDTITFTHDVEYGGTGGGSVSSKRFRISDIDWIDARGAGIQDVQVLSSERGSLLEFGPSSKPTAGD